MGERIRHSDIALTEYRRSGKVAYLDPIRGFLIQAKPEERVRQEFLRRLMREYAVPHSALAVEYPLRRSGSVSKRRADILIIGASGPLMVIECKEPDTPLHDGVWEQARDYADELECQYIALTNGNKTEAFHRVGGSWKSLAGFPPYRDMQSPRALQYRPPKSRSFPPLTLRQLKDHDFLAAHEAKLSEDWNYCVLGEDTHERLRTPIYLLYNALFHQPLIGSHLPRQRGRFRVEEYLGIHFTEYGNYSGGTFPGLYSSFRVKDARGDDQIYKIGFFSTLHTENHPVWGNRKGTSGIHLAIDDFDRAPHMSLELSLDACLKPRPGGFDVVHDGKITVGRLGAAKRDVLLDFVVQHAPQLVRERCVVLGTFPTGRVLTFDDIGELVFNLLHYAEIRDRFRAEYKKHRRHVDEGRRDLLRVQDRERPAEGASRRQGVPGWSPRRSGLVDVVESRSGQVHGGCRPRAEGDRRSAVQADAPDAGESTSGRPTSSPIGAPSHPAAPSEDRRGARSGRRRKKVSPAVQAALRRVEEIARKARTD